MFQTQFIETYTKIVDNDWFWNNYTDVLRHLKAGNAVYGGINRMSYTLEDHCDLKWETMKPIANRYSLIALWVFTIGLITDNCVLNGPQGCWLFRFALIAHSFHLLALFKGSLTQFVQSLVGQWKLKI